MSPHSWTILEGENPRILQKIRSPIFQCSRVHEFGRTLVVIPNKSEAFKLTMNAGYGLIKSDWCPHSWTILEGENPRILQKIRSPVFQCSRVHEFGRALVVFPNKSEAFKLTMNAGLE
jgi:hypothetical protein